MLFDPVLTFLVCRLRIWILYVFLMKYFYLRINPTLLKGLNEGQVSSVLLDAHGSSQM